MSENLSERVEFFRRSIQQMIDSRAEPSYDLLRSLLVEDERLAEWERRKGTAPQEAQADPQPTQETDTEKALSRYIYELGQPGQPMNLRLTDVITRLSAIADEPAPTGTAPQRPKADPKKDVCPNCGEVANGCNYCRKTPAPVPQTEGECPQCGGDGKGPLTHHFGEPCPTCSGTGKEGEK